MDRQFRALFPEIKEEKEAERETENRATGIREKITRTPERDALTVPTSRPDTGDGIGTFTSDKMYVSD
ncbi:hypothetical protein PHLCEN_2v13430 [Hermanssonia centrifuga]|uniref:Uncharacterized protein n=1 Tax=Hermanssonia centrifuga TaxID=98765 RepID=A0A2R6NE98_9APHY|nr:hypothetical protein PHLCEN_2v13430 [Hermanssonia centrifuga]